MNPDCLYDESGLVKPKLLIVDDNSMLRETTRSIFKANFPELHIFEAGDGKEALIQIRDHLPNLIFMDIRLPDENGLILTQKIKALYPEIVIIIFTNYDLQEYRDAAFKNGADFFFPKTSPSKKKMRKIVERILAETDSPTVKDNSWNNMQIRERRDSDMQEPTKEAYMEKINAKIKEFGAKLDQLKAKADQVDAETKIKINQQIERLLHKKQEAKTKLNELKAGGKGAWNNLKIGMDAAISDLKTGVEKAMSELKK